MARPRQPDALTSAERQRRHVQAHGLVNLRISPAVRARLAEACGATGGTRSEVLLAALELYLRTQRTEVVVPTAAIPAASAPPPRRPSSRRAPFKDESELL